MPKKDQVPPHPYFVAFRTAVSHARLQRYRREAPGDLEAIALYAWNIELCEAMYPALNLIEIAVRNRVNVVLSKKFRIHAPGSFNNIQSWLDANPGVIHDKEQPWIDDAKRKLRQQNVRRRPEDRALTPGRLVAALGFGFWTSLFDGRYDENGNAPEQLWPDLAPDMFPRMPRRIRTPTDMSRYLEDIRDLRNRAFHHEPIWGPNQQGQPVEERYAKMAEFLEWVDPASSALLSHISRFDSVHGGRERAMLAKVEVSAEIALRSIAARTQGGSEGDSVE